MQQDTWYGAIAAASVRAWQLSTDYAKGAQVSCTDLDAVFVS